MTALSTLVKNYILVFKHEERPNLYIDKDQFTRLHDFMMDYKKPMFVDLLDDRGNYSETLKRGDFTLRQADVKYDTSTSRWMCGFGTRHLMHEWPVEKCGCKEKYTSDEMMVRTSAEFKQWAAKFLNATINYDGDLTDEHRRKFLEAKEQCVK